MTQFLGLGITGSVLTGRHGVDLMDIQCYGDLIHELKSIISLKVENHDVWTLEELQLIEEFKVKYQFFVLNKHDQNSVMLKSFIQYLEQIRNFLIK